MTLTTSHHGRKIRVVLAALGAAAVLAGCAQPAHMNTDQTLSGAGLTGTACRNGLDLNFADNGHTWCVRLGGCVMINMLGPGGGFYPGVEPTGSVLTPDSGMRVPFGELAFRASSRGTTVITSAALTCMPVDVPAAACPTGSPWSVTVIVR